MLALEYADIMRGRAPHDLVLNELVIELILAIARYLHLLKQHLYTRCLYPSWRRGWRQRATTLANYCNESCQPLGSDPIHHQAIRIGDTRFRGA